MSETQSNPTLDSQNAEAFTGRLLVALNDGGLCLMASIGRCTGLFEAMREQPPTTSGEIAARTGLNERYVREWLGGHGHRGSRRGRFCQAGVPTAVSATP